MTDHRTRFLHLAIEAQALRFGEFVLKSGRTSPYFFNAGRFDSGALMAGLAACYADALEEAGTGFDMLFGPAYKGIPLATALACEFARRGRDLPVAFDRKEAKAHGEGGNLIGAPMKGRRVLVVDDVITAAGGVPAGIVIGLDRQEVIDESASPRRSAAQAVAEELSIPVVAVAGLDDLLAFTSENVKLSEAQARLRDYRGRYGAG